MNLDKGTFNIDMTAEDVNNLIKANQLSQMILDFRGEFNLNAGLRMTTEERASFIKIYQAIIKHSWGSDKDIEDKEANIE